MRPLLIAACAASLFACAPPPEEPANVRLYALDCGRINTSDAAAFSDEGAYDGQARELVNPCYLIRHRDGDLLWDLGFPDTLVDNPTGVEFGPMRFSMSRKLADQLAELGIAAGDIDFISFSHSHGDHVGNAGGFPNATWIVDTDERAHMFRDEARAGQEFASYASLETVTPVLIEGDAEHDVFGDGTVTIIQTPGHTPGHTILRVRLANAGDVLLTGDMYHMAESRADRRVPIFNTNREQTLASMDKIERIAADTGARVVRQHVPEDFAAMPAFPQALD